MKKDVIIAVLATFCLTATLFMVSSSVGYDPWADLNDDGKIDMKDIGQVARAFGATGTAINKTALLLELQEGLEELNATVDSLEQRVSSLEGQLTVVAHAEVLTTSTDGVGNVVVTYPEGKFTATPSLSITAWFSSSGIGQMGYVTVSGHSSSGFTLNVKDGIGSNWNGVVQISYVAVGTSASNGYDCIVVTGSKPYNEPIAYVSGTGFVINVSDSIPSGFTLVSAFATGRKTDLGGTTLDEPPLNLLPTVNGINIEIRVWDAGGTEYDNWSNQRAHIDYTLFITK